MLIHVYRLLFLLYPARIRSVFGREMTAVLRHRQADASNKGALNLVALWAREFASLLPAALRERARVLRQWPHSGLEEQPAVTGSAGLTFDGVPAFYTCEGYSPRWSALIQGGILSLALFGAVTAAFEYGVNPLRFRMLTGAHDSGESQFIETSESGLAFGRSAVSSANGVLVMILGERSVGTTGTQTGGRKTGTLWSKVLLLFSRSAFLQSQASTPLDTQLPDTPAARQYRELMQARKTGDYQRLRRFYAEHFEGATPEAIDGNAATWVDMYRRFGPPDINKLEVLESTPHRLVVVVQSQAGSWSRHEIEVAAEPPHRIKLYEDVGFGSQKPGPGMTGPPPHPGLPPGLRQPPAPAFSPGNSPWEKPFAVSRSVLKSYAGTYDFGPPTGLEMTVTYKGGRLVTQIPGQQKALMFPQSETKFYAKGLVMRWIEFIKDENGKVTELVANSSGIQVKAHRRKSR